MKTLSTWILKPSLAVLAGMLLLWGCGGNKSTNPNTSPPPTHSSHFHSMAISNMAFSPVSMPIAIGDTAQWTNNDGVAHTVTSDSGNELSSGNIGPGQRYMHVFMAAGAFPYHCTIHTSMHGLVTVQ